MNIEISHREKKKSILGKMKKALNYWGSEDVYFVSFGRKWEKGA